MSNIVYQITMGAGYALSIDSNNHEAGNQLILKGGDDDRSRPALEPRFLSGHERSRPTQPLSLALCCARVQ